MHLLVPHFVDDRPETRDALRATPPAALLRWLQHARPVARSAAPAAAGYASGVERYVANALSLDVADGALPWAALQRHWQGLPADGAWGELRLVHWRVGRDDIVLHPQLALGVTPDEHAAIEQSIAALLRDDGLQLHTVQPGVWHVQGDPLRGLRTASAVRAAGRDMRNFQPLAADGRVARTWQRVAA
ncbi:MAG: hypothetical protein KGQ77_12535, partial [Betaproteobacteria bacterium]|nr:hypothetical protein [Betaproteobacteria bacterium]